jgi:hypothetical protein
MPSARRPSSYRQYYCAKQGDGGTLAAQELNQLIDAVAEASPNAVATARFPDFVQQH